MLDKHPEHLNIWQISQRYSCPEKQFPLLFDPYMASVFIDLDAFHLRPGEHLCLIVQPQGRQSQRPEDNRQISLIGHQDPRIEIGSCCSFNRSSEVAQAGKRVVELERGPINAIHNIGVDVCGR